MEIVGWLILVLMALLALHYFVTGPAHARMKREQRIEAQLRQEIVDQETRRKVADRILREAGHN